MYQRCHLKAKFVLPNIDLAVFFRDTCRSSAASWKKLADVSDAPNSSQTCLAVPMVSSMQQNESKTRCPTVPDAESHDCSTLTSAPKHAFDCANRKTSRAGTSS